MKNNHKAKLLHLERHIAKSQTASQIIDLIELKRDDSSSDAVKNALFEVIRDIDTMEF